MRTLRTLHLYLGSLFAPALLVLAISGAWQIFRWNDAKKDDKVTRRPAVVTLCLLAGILAPTILLTSCAKPASAKPPEDGRGKRDAGKPTAAKAAPAPAAVWTPGLGELMSLQQMRHVKLWFAGEAGNWKLADYELDELKEGFEDVVRLHPTHKDSPVPVSQVVPKIMDAPLLDVRKAIEANDRIRFRKTYDGVTAGCNSCHQATNFGFNVVRRPASNPYPSQSFAPP